MTLLQANRLDVRVGDRTLCQALDLTLRAGDCLAILGPNGSGKTSLLHTLAGLRCPESGWVDLHGEPLAGYAPRTRARHIGLLLQQQPSPFPVNVLEYCLQGRHPHLQRWQHESEQDLALATQALARVGLETMLTRQIATLSGGERQRLALATLFTQQAPLLLLDEPTNHLDLHQQIRVLDLIAAHRRQPDQAVILVLHDINLAARYGNRFLLLFGDGSHIHGDAATTLTEATLSRLYHHPIKILGDPGDRYYVPA